MSRPIVIYVQSRQSGLNLDMNSQTNGHREVKCFRMSITISIMNKQMLVGVGPGYCPSVATAVLGNHWSQ